MAGRNTVLSSPELCPRGSHHLVLPFRKPVRETQTQGSSSNENKQSEGYLKPRSPKKGVHYGRGHGHGHGIKIKNEDDIPEQAADLKISIFTRATTRVANAIKSSQEKHLRNSKSQDLGRPVNNSKMSRGNVVDLTLDSDEEPKHYPPRAGLRPVLQPRLRPDPQLIPAMRNENHHPAPQPRHGNAHPDPNVEEVLEFYRQVELNSNPPRVVVPPVLQPRSRLDPQLVPSIRNENHHTAPQLGHQHAPGNLGMDEHRSVQEVGDFYGQRGFLPVDEEWEIAEHMYEELDNLGGLGERVGFLEPFHNEPLARQYAEGFQVMDDPAPAHRPEEDSRFREQMRNEAYARLEGRLGYGERREVLGFQPPLPPQSASVPEQDLNPRLESEHELFTMLENVFPGICPDYVSTLHKTAKTSDQIIEDILNLSSYPRAKETRRELKRKRDMDPDDEAARNYGSADRIIPGNPDGIRPYIRTILASEFSWVAMESIDKTLKNCGYRLFSAYQLLVTAMRTYKPKPAPQTYNRMKRPRKEDPTFNEDAVAEFLANPNKDQERVDVLIELQTVRRIRLKEESRSKEELLKQIEEDENTKKAEADGAMGECGCCFGDYPLNRMVHCNGEVQHDFCRDCARRNAEGEVGKSKYELTCMSMDKCNAGFDTDQRSQFLDEKLQMALDRIEKEAMLQALDNVARCPFCPFAAEYPPIDIDREFHCLNPECEKVSCRLCEKESHIPKTCEEAKKDENLSVRRRIEEAMSAALIRRCNKCNAPFIKEEGCNKMTCNNNGCGNIQCYVCSKSCGYDHFNDRTRGGKVGNCPLFEDVEQRHEGEVSKAQKEAIQKVLAENPEFDENDMAIQMSEKVKEDDARRKNGPGRVPVPAPHMPANFQGLGRVLQAHRPLAQRLNIPPVFPFQRRQAEPHVLRPEVPPAAAFLPDPFDEFVEFDDVVY